MQHFDSNPRHIVSILQHLLEQRAETDAQVWSTERMQPVTMSRGVRIMGVRHCVHTWYNEWKAQLPQISHDVKVSVAMELFRSPYLEDKFSAIVLVGEHLISEHIITVSHMAQFANLIDTSCISGYEVCDRFSQLVLKNLLIVQRHETMPIIGEWVRCENSWRARAALLALIPLAKDAIYENLILDGCAIVLDKTEDCCKLAVGSALRALARTSQGVVYEFLNEDHNLIRMSAHGLSRACGDQTRWKEIFRNKRKEILRSRRSAQTQATAVDSGGASASSTPAPPSSQQMVVSLPVATEVAASQARLAVPQSETILPSVSELMGRRALESGSSVPVTALIHAPGPQDAIEGTRANDSVNVGSGRGRVAANGVFGGENGEELGGESNSGARSRR
ncbi:DNA alkylation repair enzyme [Gracilaria domingensis]|nr:DNA alkylation repair enzyme [Gracilaria domingensis]